MKTTTSFVFFFNFVIYSQTQTITVNNNCKTTDNRNGICVSLYSCKSVIDMLSNNTDPIQWGKILATFNCGIKGNEQRVCCPLKRNARNTDRSIPPPPDVSKHPNLKFLPKDCGKVEAEDRILAGHKTDLFKFPWMARLLYNDSEGLIFDCAGTILNERYILTAAHCLTPFGKQLIGVRIGDHDYSTPVDCSIFNESETVCAPPPQNLNIEEIIPHPDFNRKWATNDIGLLRLSSMNLSLENTGPVCLPVDKDQNYSASGAVAGWGKGEGSQPNPDLQETDLQLVSLRDCQKAYSKNMSISYRHLCAGGRKKIDSCFGDGGGAFHVAVLRDGDVRIEQRGIVSLGHSKLCGTVGLPGIYTNVVYYVDWILNTIKP